MQPIGFPLFEWIVFQSLANVFHIQHQRRHVKVIFFLDGIFNPNDQFDVFNPSIAKTNDGFLTFEVYDNATNMSDIYAANWLSGDANVVATVSNVLGYPSYTGDDAAIVYSSEDGATPTGSSLFNVGVTDRVTPAGPGTQTLVDAAFGTVYRRGTFTTPNTPPQASISSPIKDVTIDAGQAVMFTATGSDANGHYPMTYAWDFGGASVQSSDEDPGMVTFTTPGTYTVTLTGTDSQGLADSTPDTRTVTVNATNNGGGGGGGGGCAYDPTAGFDPTLLAAGAVLFVLAARRRRTLALER